MTRKIGRPDRARVVALVVTATLAAAWGSACKSRPSAPPPAPTEGADASLTTLRGPVTARDRTSDASVDAPAVEPKRESPPPRPARGPTAEEVLDRARARVTEAAEHAGGKDVCPEILRRLDGSYSLVRGSVPLDERTLGIFATCAARAQRWRPLRDLGDAIAAGERKLATTYFLPRALVGEADYEKAHTLSKETLRAWPTEGEAYDTGALAALRMKDWDGAVKAADQALLLQRKRGANDEVTALAHALRGAALLRTGKTDEGVRELDAAKAHEDVLALTDLTLDAAHAAKQSGVLAAVDAPREVYGGLGALYAKNVAPLAGLVTVILQNLDAKPVTVTVEVALAGADPAAQTETLVKGRAVTLSLTPSWKPGGALATLKVAEKRELTVTVTGGADHAVLLKHEGSVLVEPADRLPRVLRAHGEDLRSAFALEAAWVTKSAPGVTALVTAAKARLHGATKAFDGPAGPSLPQVQSLWDELRGRGVILRRDPTVDSEALESVPCRLPGETLASGSGDALEGSVLLASLLEAVGLEVILVRTPGHRLIGWLGTHADLAARESTPGTVKSPVGQVYFLETTTVGEGPLDAAVLRGDAEWVAATNDGSVTRGVANVERLAELRRRGILGRDDDVPRIEGVSR